MKNCLVHWCFDMLVDMSDHIRPEKGHMGTNRTKISSFSNTPSVKLAFWNLFKSDILVNVSFISCNKKKEEISIICYILIESPIRTYIWRILLPSIFFSIKWIEKSNFPIRILNTISAWRLPDNCRQLLDSWCRKKWWQIELYIYTIIPLIPTPTRQGYFSGMQQGSKIRGGR